MLTEIEANYLIIINTTNHWPKRADLTIQFKLIPYINPSPTGHLTLNPLGHWALQNYTNYHKDPE